MSGKNLKGPQQKSKIQQKGKPVYPPGEIIKESVVSIDDDVGRSKKDIKIGFRIKANQNILSFKLSGKKPNGNPVEIPSNPEGPPPPGELSIADELETVSPAAPAGEKWVGYIAQYKPKEHGLDDFQTSLEVDHFDVNPKGFQEVAVAFTYAEKHFHKDHYLVATSILPGSDAPAIASLAKKKKTKTKKKKKGK